MRQTGPIIVALMLAWPAIAAPPPPASPPGAVTDDRLKAGFERLAEADRRALQDALLWTGDFVGVINGTFGPRTRDALAAFAKKNAVLPESVLDPQVRARLLAAGVAARAEVGFGPVKDKPAGVVVSLPMKLLTRRTMTDGGTRYASSEGAIVVDTLSRPAGQGGLPEIFDRMSAASGARKVTYKLLRPDFFVVSGEIGERKFYSRFVLGLADAQATIRGLTLAYPKAETRMDMISLAAAASFNAFPPTVPPGSGSSADMAAATATAAAAAVKPPASPPASFALTAIRIDSGSALTHLSARSCLKPNVGGVPVTLRRRDDASGLALFDLPLAETISPTLMSEPATDDTVLLALVARDPDGLEVAPARRQEPLDPSQTSFAITAGIQGRAEGTPIIDRQGRLAGLLSEPRRPAAILADARLDNDYPVIGHDRLKAFLANAVLSDGVSSTSAQSLGSVVAQWRPRMVRIICQAAGPTP